ncbi:SU10 major capsid protein [Bacteroides ovatus]|nr:hypothetical protein [Bacteroides ovatus]MCS3035201.1 hypothetical protein [Bacteroides ovatus]
MKKAMNFFCRITLMILAFVTSASSGVMMADASNLPDAGKVTAGADGTGGTDGIATETGGRENGDPNFYLSDVDKRIVKIRPMATPIDQISRYAKSDSTNSFEVKYYSVGTREIKCATNKELAAMTSGASVSLPVDDVNMFTLDDTIRVVGISAITKPDGTAYTNDDSNVPDLVLCVCGKDSTTNLPTVYAVNGTMDTSSKQPILVPAIPSGTTLVRMGKACGELDVQTGRFNNIPMPETQYCQNFMIQVEQSTFDKIAAKEVNWNFSDIEEDGVYDMRLAMENTYLFGVKQVIKHIAKDGMNTWFTGGIWWMAGKDIEVGEWNSEKNCAEITDENLVDITKDLFVGTGIGNKRKILFCGSDMLSAFSKIKSEKFRLKDTVDVWNLKFKSWDTDFGEVLTIHHELFDVNGMSDCGFAMDPEYLSKKTHVSWARNVLDLQKAGIRRTDAVVIQEVSCLYLRYAKAHARMRLAKSPTTVEESGAEAA